MRHEHNQSLMLEFTLMTHERLRLELERETSTAAPAIRGRARENAGVRARHPRGAKPGRRSGAALPPSLFPETHFAAVRNFFPLKGRKYE